MIEHDNLFNMLERYVEIGGSALRIIRHIFVIVHKEFKLSMSLILLVCCVVYHRAQFGDQRHFVCNCFHLVRYLKHNI